MNRVKDSELFASRREFGWMTTRILYPKEVPMLVDLGPLDQKAGRDCADRLFSFGVSRKNLSIEGNRRILMRIPPAKIAAVLKRFRFKEGVSYFQCTHHRAGVGASE